MRVLLIHKFFWPSGGDTEAFFQTARALEENGHEVAFLSTRNEKNPESEWARYFPDPPSFDRGSALTRAASLPAILYSRRAKEATRALIRDFRPDLVNAFAVYTHFSLSVLDACAEEGVPVVLSCHDYKHICPNYKLYHHGRVCEDCRGGRYYSAVLNRCAKDSLVFSVASAAEAYANAWNDLPGRVVDGYVFPSEFIAGKTREFWGREPAPFHVVRNPFDAARRARSTEDDGYVLSLGRLVEEKGIDVLLRAAAGTDLRIKVVGDGPIRGELEALKGELGAAGVEFLGARYGDEKEELLRRCRAVVIPSLWYENYPYVILEAQAYGKPVVASRTGGMPEMVQEGETGLLAPVGDVEALRAALERLHRDPEEAARMGAAAKERVDAVCDPEAFFASVMQAYEASIAHHRARGGTHG